MPCQWPEMFHKLCRHLPELAIHQAYQDGTEKTKEKKSEDNILSKQDRYSRKLRSSTTSSSGTFHLLASVRLLRL